MSKHSRRRLLAEMYGDRCFYCGCEFTPIQWDENGRIGGRSRTIDHMIPISRFPASMMMPGKKKLGYGGPWAFWNLALCCDGCNRAKGDLIWYEYYQTDIYWKRREAVHSERPSKKPRTLSDLRSA